ncbi:MAG: hypothetical protein ACP5SP_06595 [Caldisericum sp.]|uniref:hypothetical protein n=1 Tax=Caldisericum sp. TaxID=2499687 RepID=UPI003D1243EA
MIVIFFILLLFIVILQLKIDVSEKKEILVVLLVILIWNLLWLVLVQAELFYKGVYTYGSDANYYYNEFLRCLGNARPFYTAMHSRLAPLYVLFGTFILKTSPNLSSVWIKLSNILLIEVIFVLIYFWMRTYIKRTSLIINLLFFFGLNGIITWTVLRELKDIFFVFLVIINLSGLDYLLKKGKSLQAILFTGLMIYLQFNVRMFAVAIPLVILFIYILVWRKSIKRNLYYLLGAFVILILLFEHKRIAWFYTGFIYYAGRFREPLTLLGSSSITQILIAPFRFLIGPGPIRALEESEVFVVTTNMGNILIFLGSILWWIILPILFMVFVFDFKFIFRNLYFFATPIFIALMYSIMYLGTGDTRLRATTYILFIPAICKYLEYLVDNKPKKLVLTQYIISSMFVWFFSILLSILTT